MNKDSKTVSPIVNEKIGFLVMTRRPNEGVMIGDDIHVMVTRLMNGQVRLAIYAPRDVKISKTVSAKQNVDG